MQETPQTGREMENALAQRSDPGKYPRNLALQNCFGLLLFRTRPDDRRSHHSFVRTAECIAECIADRIVGLDNSRCTVVRIADRTVEVVVGNFVLMADRIAGHIPERVADGSPASIAGQAVACILENTLAEHPDRIAGHILGLVADCNPDLVRILEWRWKLALDRIVAQIPAAIAAIVAPAAGPTVEGRFASTSCAWGCFFWQP